MLSRKKRAEKPLQEGKTELQLPSSQPEGWTQTPLAGLTEEETRGRRRNLMPRDDGKPTVRIILENVFTLFNGLNLLLAAALLLVGSYRNMMFLGVVVFNTGIAIVQEIRSRNTIRKLKLLHAAKVHVIRDGREETIAPEDAVEGDMIVLRAGDQVVADCLAISGGCRADESLLTGESNDIPKGEGDWLYSGSWLTEGKVFCQAVYVGEESYVGRLTKEAKRGKQAASGLMREMKRLIRWDSIALLPLGLLLLAKQVCFSGMTVRAAVPSIVAAMLGMIPEGLILLTSMSLAVGVMRLGKRKVLVQELYGIENLARVDVLCLDKTGTLTTGRMRMEHMEPAEATREEAAAAMSRFLGAFDDRSGTLQALREKIAPGSEEPVAIQPFSSKRKKSAASFADGTTLILGAPEYVMGGGMTDSMRERIAGLAEGGNRVLILAEAKGVLQGDQLPEPVRPLGIFALTDEVRPHAEDTTAYFRKEGVTLKVISGDDPATVSRIAMRAGIQGWENAADARKLTDEAAMLEACEKYTVFGRVTPEQKKQLVEALKAAGHTVAMTGDGVNDIPALRAADCSIAMAEGADAARHAAQMTLLESDFAAVPEIVLEGRRVINNITRSATLFLTKTIFSFLLSLLTLGSPGAYPFQPIHLTLISSCTVGIPGFLLAMEKGRERIRGKFLRTVLRKALPGGAAVAVCAMLAMFLTRAGWEHAACSTLAVWTTGLLGVVTLCRACWPLNLRRGLIAGGGLTLFVLLACLFEDVFYLTGLKGTEWAVMAGLTALGIGLIFLTDRMMDSLTFWNAGDTMHTEKKERGAGTP